MNKRKSPERPFTCEKVKDTFKNYPPKHRQKLMELRQLIFSIAESLEDVGPIEETLKWGEPSYLTSETKSGTTIRIDWKPKNPGHYAIYFHCQTDLVKRCRQQFPESFTFEGNRGIFFDVEQPIPLKELSQCFSDALTYHRNK